MDKDDTFAPDEPGDSVDPEVADLVTTDPEEIVPDNVDKGEVDDS